MIVVKCDVLHLTCYCYISLRRHGGNCIYVCPPDFIHWAQRLNTDHFDLAQSWVLMLFLRRFGHRDVSLQSHVWHRDQTGPEDDDAPLGSGIGATYRRRAWGDFEPAVWECHGLLRVLQGSGAGRPPVRLSGRRRHAGGRRTTAGADSPDSPGGAHAKEIPLE